MSKNMYRAAIVGLGMVAVGRSPKGEPPEPFGREILNRHVHTINDLPNVELVSVCDIAPAAISRFKDLWGRDLPNVNTYTDLDEMLSKEELDIVGVTTADHTHAGVTIAVANAGVKGIYLEKPLATDLDEADRMIAACEENGVILNVGHTRRYRPLITTVREAIRSGAIGKIGAIVLMQFGSGATLFRNGTHFIDIMCFIADANPTKVSAILDEGFDDWDKYRGDGGRTRGNEPGAIGTIIFSNGVRGSYVSTINNSYQYVNMVITGSDGNIEFGLNGDSFELTKTLNKNVAGTGAQTVVPKDYQIIGIPAGYRELLDMIENGGTSVSPAREARKTVQIMTGFLESNQRGSALIDLSG